MPIRAPRFATRSPSAAGAARLRHRHRGPRHRQRRRRRALRGRRRRDRANHATLFARQLDAGMPAKQRGWFDVELPLAAYAGRRVEPCSARRPRPGAASPNFVATSRHGRTPSSTLRALRRPRRQEPNVFLISVDTLRADHLVLRLRSRHEPGHRRLCSRGGAVRERVHHHSRTTPALASLLTGLYPRAHGLMTLLHSLPADRSPWPSSSLSGATRPAPS